MLQIAGVPPAANANPPPSPAVTGTDVNGGDGAADSSYFGSGSTGVGVVTVLLASGAATTTGSAAGGETCELVKD
jgi:hypothetical protein